MVFDIARLREALEKRGVSQAKAASVLSVTPSHFSRMIRGLKPMSAEMVDKLLREFEIDQAEVIAAGPSAGGGAKAGTDVILTFFGDWERGGHAWRWTVAEAGRLYDLFDEDGWKEFAGLVAEIIRQLKSLSEAAVTGIYILLADAKREHLEFVLNNFDREERAAVTLAVVLMTRPAVAFRARLVVARIKDESGYHAAPGFRHVLPFLASPGTGDTPGQADPRGGGSARGGTHVAGLLQ